MKIILGLFLCLCSVSVFGQTNSDLMQSNEKFTKDGLIRTKPVALALLYKIEEKTKYKFETGKLNDVQYEFSYSDGKGLFSSNKGGKLDVENLKDNWIAICSKDSITDSKYCTLSSHNLLINVTPSNSYGLRVGVRDIKPFSFTAIRIDTNTAFTSKEKGVFRQTDINSIIDQLKSGNKVVLRYTKKYENSPIDEQFDLYGFNEALQYISWAVSKIK